MAASERFGQTASGGDCPAQVDLLGADAADQRREQIKLADLANPREPFVKRSYYRISRKKSRVVCWRWRECRFNGRFDELLVARVRVHFESWRLEIAGVRGHEWHA